MRREVGGMKQGSLPNKSAGKCTFQGECTKKCIKLHLFRVVVPVPVPVRILMPLPLSSEALTMKTVGEIVQKRRRQLGHTQETLASFTGVSKRTVVKLEQGCDVRFSTLATVLSALGLALDFSALSKERLAEPSETDDDWV